MTRSSFVFNYNSACCVRIWIIFCVCSSLLPMPAICRSFQLLRHCWYLYFYRDISALSINGLALIINRNEVHKGIKSFNKLGRTLCLSAVNYVNCWGVRDLIATSFSYFQFILKQSFTIFFVQSFEFICCTEKKV